MQAATRYNGRTENIRGEPKKCPMKDARTYTLQAMHRNEFTRDEEANEVAGAEGSSACSSEKKNRICAAAWSSEDLKKTTPRGASLLRTFMRPYSIL